MVAFLALAVGEMYAIGSMWSLVLFHPAAMIVCLLAMRPLRRLPDTLCLDWGSTLGHAWLRYPDGLRFVRAQVRDEKARTAAQVPLESTLDGFALSVPRQRPALPSWLHTVRWSLAGSMAVAGGLGLLLLIFLHQFDGRGLSAVNVATITSALLPVAILYALLPVLFWAVPLLLPHVLARWMWSTKVVVQGRVVRTDHGSFTLGSPEQLLELSPGRLRLLNDEQELVIEGAGAHLVALRDALERLGRAEPGEESVPEALRDLRQPQVLRSRTSRMV